MEARVALCIMAKSPVAGRVKTRLCPPLSAVEAAELYRCFLLDKIAQVRDVGGAHPALAYAPDSAGGIFAALAPGFTLLPQGGGDLTSRLLSVIERLLAAGFEAAVMIDSDTPTLPTALLARGVSEAASKERDLVLGPSEDGGYYLIGLRRPLPGLFEGMPWSTPAVFDETERRARRLGLSVARLGAWHDVDTEADLVRLAADLESSSAGSPGHTRRFVRERLAGRTTRAGGRV